MNINGSTWTWTELATYFQAAEEVLGSYDPGPLLDHLRGLLAESVAGNFEGKHDPAGNPWAPSKHNYGHPLMVHTGDLMSAAIDMAWKATITHDGLRFDETGLPFYWKFHQEGTRKMAARPFFGISMELTHEIEDLLAQDVVARMQAV